MRNINRADKKTEYGEGCLPGEGHTSAAGQLLKGWKTKLLQYLSRIRTGKTICPRREPSNYKKSHETGNDSPVLMFEGTYPAIGNIRLLFLQPVGACILWKILLIQGCDILIIDGSKSLK